MSRDSKTPISTPVVSGIVRAVDMLLVLACAGFSWSVYLIGESSAIEFYVPVVLGAILLQANVFHFAGLYRFETYTNLFYQIGRLLVAWSFVIFVLITVAFLTKTSAQFSRGWILIWFASTLCTLIFFRVTLYTRICRWAAGGRLIRTIAIIGAGEQCQRLLRYLGDLRGSNIRIAGVFDDRKDSRVPEFIEGHPRIGDTDDLIEFARQNRIDQIIIALPWSAEERLMTIMRKLRTLPVDVCLSPDMIGFHLLYSTFSRVGAVPVLNVFNKPLSDWKLLTKELEDRFLGAAILLLILPLMLLVALLIKLGSRGPVFFRQTRYGFNNQEIEVWKFRTMRHEPGPDASVPQATRDDPRVTLFGRFLRRSSLDEMPQIFNVLRGDMSLVGPRPHAVPHNEYYDGIVNEYASRHRVKPGITGWAQVNGWRGETDTVEKMQRRVEHDIHYIDNWSIAFDLKILLMTAFAVFRGENAY